MQKTIYMGVFWGVRYDWWETLAEPCESTKSTCLHSVVLLLVTNTGILKRNRQLAIWLACQRCDQYSLAMFDDVDVRLKLKPGWVSVPRVSRFASNIYLSSMIPATALLGRFSTCRLFARKRHRQSKNEGGTRSLERSPPEGQTMMSVNAQTHGLEEFSPPSW
jgi:hypothetical protein